MLGKIPTYLLRLSCVLQALHDAYEYISKNENRFVLNSDFEEQLTTHFIGETQFIISEHNIIRANNLLSFFNKNKLVLAGYSIDISKTIEECFDILISELTFNDDNQLTIEQTLIRKILEMSDKHVNLTDLNNSDSRNFTIKLVLDAGTILQNNNFGKVTECKRFKTGSYTKYFSKSYIKEYSYGIMNFLTENGVNLDIFKENNEVSKGKNIYINYKIKIFELKKY